MKWRYLIVFFGTMILSSCFTYRMPTHLKEHFTYLYTPTLKELSSQINTNGYYTIIDINTHRYPKGFSGQKWEYVTDTFYMNYLFFDDGIVIENMFSSERTSDTIDLPNFLTRMEKDTSNSLKLSGTWGTYNISGDTIKTQTIHPSTSLNDGWSGWEEHFKIIDKKTIQRIYAYPIHYLSPSNKKIYTKQYYLNGLKDEKPAIFIESEGIPSSDCWLKKEKWFWKNEKDYYEFMKRNSG